MLINFVPDRVKQIIWNDTANDPYSKESVARRLLVHFDYMPSADNAELIIKAITGYSLDEQIKLSEKNDAILKSVTEYADKALSISRSIGGRNIFEQMELEVDLKYIMKDILGLTNEQYELILDD